MLLSCFFIRKKLEFQQFIVGYVLCRTDLSFMETITKHTKSEGKCTLCVGVVCGCGVKV